MKFHLMKDREGNSVLFLTEYPEYELLESFNCDNPYEALELIEDLVTNGRISVKEALTMALNIEV